MGILDAALDSIGGVLADQWQDVITAGPFDEHTVVVPGIRKNSQNGRGNNRGADDIISNGSVIFVPENTAAFVFSQSGIERVITSPGGFEYRDGEATLFDAQNRREKGIGKILVDQAAERIRFAGMSPEEKRVAFVNLREIRGLKFGTRGPLAYNDLFYGTDLEVFAYGSFSVQVSDAELFVRNFVPANVSAYSLDDPQAREQLLSELLRSFVAAVNALSSEFRRLAAALADQRHGAADFVRAGQRGLPGRSALACACARWPLRTSSFSDESRELVRQFSERRMGVRAYEDVSSRLQIWRHSR